MQNEKILIEHELQLIQEQQKEISDCIRQKQELVRMYESNAGQNDLHNALNSQVTIPSENSTLSNNTIETIETIQKAEIACFNSSYSEWKGYGKRRRLRKESSTKRVHLNRCFNNYPVQLSNIFEDSVWWFVC